VVSTRSPSTPTPRAINAFLRWLHEEGHIALVRFRLKEEQRSATLTGTDPSIGEYKPRAERHPRLGIGDVALVASCDE
jgi:hypothetical protein